MSNSNDALQDPAERKRRWIGAVTRLHDFAIQWRGGGLTPSDLTAAGRVVDGVHSGDLPDWFVAEWEWSKRREWYRHQVKDWHGDLGAPSARQWAWLAWMLNQEPNEEQSDCPICWPHEPPYLPEGFDPVEAEWQALVGTLDKAGHRIRIDVYADMCDLIADLINDTGELPKPAGNAADAVDSVPSATVAMATTPVAPSDCDGNGAATPVDEDHFQHAAWFQLHAGIGSSMLRKAAAPTRKKLAVRKIGSGKGTRYSVLDAKKNWKDRFDECSS